MLITSAKAKELGIIVDKTKCLTCKHCFVKNDIAYCGVRKEVISIMYVALECCPLVTEEDIQKKMSPEEYNEYLYGDIEITSK